MIESIFFKNQTIPLNPRLNIVVGESVTTKKDFLNTITPAIHLSENIVLYINSFEKFEADILSNLAELVLDDSTIHEKYQYYFHYFMLIVYNLILEDDTLPLTDMLKTDHTICIDNIENNLHPKQQRTIIHKLLEVFPNAQFIITTNSPIIVSEVSHESVIQIVDNIVYFTSKHNYPTYGETCDRILESIFDTPKRAYMPQLGIASVFHLIDKELISEAKEQLSILRTKYGDVSEFTYLSSLIKMGEI